MNNSIHEYLFISSLISYIVFCSCQLTSPVHIILLYLYQIFNVGAIVIFFLNFNLYFTLEEISQHASDPLEIFTEVICPFILMEFISHPLVHICLAKATKELAISS